MRCMTKSIPPCNVSKPTRNLPQSFRNRFRRKLVPRSPFAIYYTVEGGRLIIHAVFDQRQDPQKILDRLGKD